MNKKRKFSSEFKAGIVLSILKNEVTAIEAGRKHNIATSLVYKWLDEVKAKLPQVFEVAGQESEKDRKIKHYEHVITKITTQNDFLEKVLAATR